jgi:segregation and condensation protein B
MGNAGMATDLFGTDIDGRYCRVAGGEPYDEKASAVPRAEEDLTGHPEHGPDGDQAQDAPEGRPEELRLLEALLFAASEPLDEKTLGKHLPAGIEVRAALKRLQVEYAPRGVNLVKIGNKWTFRTANDLAWLLTHKAVEPRKLSRAAVETLAIIAYHQPVTRAEIEEVRGVSTVKGTLDVLLETGWVRPRGRRKAPGRPLTYGTTPDFLSHFGLEALGDLPGLDDLKGSGLFDGTLPADFSVPEPSDDPTLREDEDPLEPGDLDLVLAPRVEENVEDNGEEGGGGGGR